MDEMNSLQSLFVKSRRYVKDTSFSNEKLIHKEFKKFVDSFEKNSVNDKIAF